MRDEVHKTCDLHKTNLNVTLKNLMLAKTTIYKQINVSTIIKVSSALLRTANPG